jgi:2-polyprenyl-6-methoxyphenol hydroxylase-like FAD-dependent oxidoreductase
MSRPTPTPSATAPFDTDVLIVGAGPTGLTLATALAARGVRAIVIDRLAAGANTSRAAVVHARTLEVLEPLGVSVQEVLWGSRFRVHHRVAGTYRAGRVVLAGDAAHVHSPAGGQGMNVGILDAMHLADALVTALAADDPAALDAYAAQRRPVAQQVVALADRLTRLATVRPVLRGLRNLLLSALSRLPRFRRQLAWRLSGLVYR